ncbi:MAG TPA: type II toxin-antitoxin system HicB family antitoxin [Polyangia bacterium]|nr:type II toxin-antitoxin system HicB family antitoxin [Polyangia bacterium]
MARAKTKARLEALRYPIEVWWSEEDQAYLAEVYDLPGCMADGRTEESAIAAAHEAIVLWLEVARAEGRVIPRPSTEQHASGKFNVRLPVSLHRRLQQMARRERVSLNQLVLSLLAEREAARRSSRRRG